MKKRTCWIIAIAIIIMSFFNSCKPNEKLDPIKDYELIRAIEYAQMQNSKEINIEILKKYASLYENKREKSKLCLCEALIGYRLFFDSKYDKSIIYLKQAETNLQYCDTLSSFVYSMIVSNTMTTDTILALHYAKKALEKDLKYNNTKKIPYSYMNMSLLSKGDSAQYYLRKSLEYFDDWGDKIAKCKYAWWHIDELHPDTIIAYAKPCYDSIQYTGHARILAEAYLRKEEPDSAIIYIEHVKMNKRFKADYNYYNSRNLVLLEKYKEASESWEIAYNQLKEESLFMFSQRLGAINAEYDLLNAELKNEKERLRMMRGYNVVLLVIIVALIVTYIIKERHRKNADNLKLNVDELEQDVCELEENVTYLEQNVNYLEGNVTNLEQEVTDLERDIEKRKKRFIVLFEEYRKVYKAHRNTIFTEALTNLSEIHKAYPDLKKTDLAIIWLTFMDCSRDAICDLLNISQTYYYQRKSIIHRILNIPVRDGDTWHKTLEKIVRKYIQIDN